MRSLKKKGKSGRNDEMRNGFTFVIRVGTTAAVAVLWLAVIPIAGRQVKTAWDFRIESRQDFSRR